LAGWIVEQYQETHDSGAKSNALMDSEMQSLSARVKFRVIPIGLLMSTRSSAAKRLNMFFSHLVYV
jgi:hypothetical protein